MKRAEIWWARLPPPSGTRPVVLVSRDVAIRLREAVTIAQVTTKIRDIPVEVRLGKEDGMKKDCVINCDVLMTIPKSMLLERIAPLSAEKTAELDAALGFALDISYHY